MLGDLRHQKEGGRVLLLRLRGERAASLVGARHELCVELLRPLEEALGSGVLAAGAPDHREMVQAVHALDVVVCKQALGSHEVLLALRNFLGLVEVDAEQVLNAPDTALPRQAGSAPR